MADEPRYEDTGRSLRLDTTRFLWTKTSHDFKNKQGFASFPIQVSNSTQNWTEDHAKWQNTSSFKPQPAATAWRSHSSWWTQTTGKLLFCNTTAGEEEDKVGIHQSRFVVLWLQRSNRKAQIEIAYKREFQERLRVITPRYNSDKCLTAAYRCNENLTPGNGPTPSPDQF